MKGNCRNISKNIAVLLVFSFFLMTACSDPSTEFEAKLNSPTKIVKVKNKLPLCCTKIPSRFPGKKISK